MTLYELEQAVRQETGHVNSDRYDLATIARHLMNAERTIAFTTKCLVNFPGDAASMLTQADGAVAADTALVVDDEKYFKPDQFIDVMTISGSSPSETITRKASNIQIASIDRDTNTLTLAENITCADDDYVGWANDIGFIDTVASETEYLVPQSALEINRVDLKYSSTGEYRPLTRSDRLFVGRAHNIQLTSSDGTTTTGWPRLWHPIGNRRFGIHPAAPTAVTAGIRVQFTRSPLPLIEPYDAPEVDEYYHDAMVQFAAAKIFAMDDEVAKAQDAKMFFSAYVNEASSAMGGNPRLRIGRGGS